MSKSISEAGARALATEEGRRLKAYKDSVGVWTIGVGHTGRMSPPKVTPGMVITERQAAEYLKADLAPTEAAVNSKVKVPITQSMYDALVSFTFNVGIGALSKSTLLRRLNTGDYAAAANEFLKWVKQPELAGRRKRERALFLKDGIPGAAVAPKPVPAPKPKPPKPEPVPPQLPSPTWVHYKPAPQYDADLYKVQERLDELGYVEVGIIDGKWGLFTIRALDTFRTVNHLPAVASTTAMARIDEMTVNRLFSGSAKSMPIGKERAEADTDTILENAPTTIAPTLWSRLAGRIQGIGSLLAGVPLVVGVALVGEDGIFGIPPVYVGVAIIVFATMGISGGLHWILAKMQVSGTKQAFRTGKIV